MFSRIRRLFDMFLDSKLPKDKPYSKISILSLSVSFLALSVISFPHALRWLRYRDPTSRARIKQLLNLSASEVLPINPRFFEASILLSKPNGVTLIMPVFGSLSIVKEALARVEACTDIPWRIVLIDDASPDSTTLPFLRSWAIRRNAHLIENKSNIGFVNSANLGLKKAIYWSDPVVLLNSDAFLPEAWASRLLRPLLEDPKVASVTPFSNDAELCSVPTPGERHSVTLNEAEKLDFFARGLNGRAQVIVPTGVGFCMAISREVLDIEPCFDPVFTPGYGEEVDWCQRLRKKGYYHVNVPNLYVAHVGGKSFGCEEKKRLILKNSSILSKRYPRFDLEVSAFLRADPLISARLALAIARAEIRRTDALPIYLGHSMGGGAEVDLQRRLKSDIERVGAALVIRVGGNFRFTVELHFSRTDGGIGLISAGTEDWVLVKRLLSPVTERKLVYSCAVGDLDPVSIPKMFLSLRGPMDELVFLVHDYFALSPNMTLLEKNEKWAGLPDPKRASSCHVARRPKNFIVSLSDWRKSWGVLVNSADHVVCFSNASKALFSEVYPSAKIEVRAHTLPKPVPILKRPALESPPVLGILGNLAPHKGAAIAQRLASASRESGCGIVLLGEIDPAYKLPPPAQKHGTYAVEDLPQLAALYQITCWLIPSLWPETFSFTTHEALATGLPVMVFDLGGQAEAVRAAEARGAHVALLPLGLAEDPQAILARARHLSH